MGLLEFFKNNKDKIDKSDRLTDADREIALEKRRMNRDLKLLQFEKEKIIKETEIEKAKIDLEKSKLDLEIAREELYSDDEDDLDINPNMMQNPDTMLMAMFMQMMNKNNNGGGVSNPIAANSNTNSPSSPPTIAQPTDEELIEIKNQLPKIYLEQAKTASEDDLRKIIKNQFPEWNEETTRKAIILLQEQKDL